MRSAARSSPRRTCRRPGLHCCATPSRPCSPIRSSARRPTRHLPSHLPGGPTVIARTMPGGGGVIASNHLYNVAPQDGTAMAIIISSFANEQLFDSPQVKYDARKFLAVGRLLDTTSVLFFWHASPIKKLADLYSRPSTIGITSTADVPAYRLRAMN